MNHRMEHAFCVLLFFLCFGGWRTSLMAASKTAFTFCSSNKLSKTLLGEMILPTDVMLIPVVFLNYTQCMRQLQSVSSAPLPSISHNSVILHDNIQAKVWEFGEEIHSSLHLSRRNGHHTRMLYQKVLLVFSKICKWKTLVTTLRESEVNEINMEQP